METQSDPPIDDYSDIACCGEVYGELVVARCDTAPVLETTKHAFDDVSAFVGLGIERLDSFAGRVIGNDRTGSSLNEEEPQGIAVIGGIGSAETTGRQGFEQAYGDGSIATLSGCYFNRDGAAATIDNSMDFCRSAASRATDGLGIRPPFPPAAERWALAIVLSIIWMSVSSVLTSASNS